MSSYCQLPTQAADTRHALQCAPSVLCATTCCCVWAVPVCILRGLFEELGVVAFDNIRGTNSVPSPQPHCAFHHHPSSSAPSSSVPLAPDQYTVNEQLGSSSPPLEDSGQSGNCSDSEAGNDTQHQETLSEVGTDEQQRQSRLRRHAVVMPPLPLVLVLVVR